MSDDFKTRRKVLTEIARIAEEELKPAIMLLRDNILADEGNVYCSDVCARDVANLMTVIQKHCNVVGSNLKVLVRFGCVKGDEGEDKNASAVG